MKEHLTLDALQHHLWSAAAILRGSLRATDSPQFIVPLLFLKWVSDRFDEERETILAEPRTPEVREEYDWFVPPSAHWRTIEASDTSIGDILNKACASLEHENSKLLEGVFRGTDYNDARFGEARRRDAILARLVQHFSCLNLRNASLSRSDIIGDAYEKFLEMFAEEAGKSAGDFHTPHEIARLIVEILEPVDGMWICDPTCGSGSMLIECASYVAAHGGARTSLSLFGQEKSRDSWFMAKLNMLFHGIKNARIEKGDTLREPRFVTENNLTPFDLVVANPPFSLSGWGREVAENDPWNRFRFGVPPRGNGDLAFVQHMIATVKPDGKLAVIIPHGALFRRGAEGEIRKRIVEEDLVDAVIGLPPRLFLGTGIPVAVLVIDRAKPRERKGKTIFIDASRDYGEGRLRNRLRDEDVKKIAAVYAAFSDVPHFSRIASIEVIGRCDFALNIQRYVESNAVPRSDVGEALRRLRLAESALTAARGEMNRLLLEMGFDE